MNPKHYQLEQTAGGRRWYHIAAKWMAILLTLYMFLLELFWFYLWWGFAGLVAGLVLMPSTFVFPMVFLWVTGDWYGALLYGAVLAVTLAAFWLSLRGES